MSEHLIGKLLFILNVTGWCWESYHKLNLLLCIGVVVVWQWVDMCRFVEGITWRHWPCWGCNLEMLVLLEV